MASEADATEPSLIERLIRSRNRDLSLFVPFILGFTRNPLSGEPRDDLRDPDRETEESAATRDRIVLINPLTQGMVVIEGSSSSLDSLLRNLVGKDGQPPASRASIEALPEVDGVDEGECAICLEEWGAGEVAKEMPCGHRFHGGCVEKWLGIHGSCPLCRYEMPVDEDQDLIGKVNGEGGRGRREIWFSFSFSGERTRSGDSNQTASSSESNPVS